MATMEDLSRQRLDFEEGADGSTTAILTVTLGDGTVHRYRETTNPEELDQLAAVFATGEARQMRIEGALSEDEIAGLFSGIVKGFKKIANVAKKVATSKVFRAAGRGLAMAAPALGPFAPAAMAVSAGMEMTGRLARSSVAAQAGAKSVARKLTKVARKKAKRRTKKQKGWAKLAKYANSKRKKAFKRVAKSKKRKKKKRGKRRKAKRAKRPNILTAARKGKLRSNKKGSVTAASLAKAAKKGRVYWLAA